MDEFLSEAEDLQISQFLLDSTSVSRTTGREVQAETESGPVGEKQLKLFRESGDLIEETLVERVENHEMPENIIATDRSAGYDQGQHGTPGRKKGTKNSAEKIFKTGSRYRCEDCGTAYSTRNGLWYHRRSKHQILSLPGNILSR